MFDNIKYYAILFVTSLLPIVYLFGIKSGTDKRKIKELEGSLDTSKTANEVQDEIQNRTDSDVGSDLSKWMRDN